MTSKEKMVSWIQENTKNTNCIVDFGCMFGSRFKYAGNPNTIKIGIELFKPYLDNAVESFIKIHGNMCNFNKLIDKKYYDCAMIIDSIEHLEKNEALNLLKEIQKLFNKILLITPEHFFIFEKDLSGYDSHESQRHKSGWEVEEFKNLGFKVELISDFHPPSDNNPRGCIFAIWEKQC